MLAALATPRRVRRNRPRWRKRASASWYEPYGEVSATGSSNNPYQYTGRENDGTGLYYYRARYYSPTLKRFISEDPMGLAAGLNEYAYADASPTDNIDPTGLESGQFSLQYHYDPSEHSPCVDGVATRFILNEIPFVGTAIDLVELGYDDRDWESIFGSFHGTLEAGVVDPLENSIEASRGSLGDLISRQMYNKQQRRISNDIQAKIAMKKGFKAVVHTAGILSLMLNIEEAREGMKKCECGGN
jgi:RHS repeat-associated protein